MKNFLSFIETPQATIPYDARLELKRRHYAELREAWEESRRGSTLTEVLVALLIMAIGIVALAAIFPISVLRTVSAHKLTEAADLRFAAESLIDRFPQVVMSPQVLPTDPTFSPAVSLYVIDPLGFINAPAANQSFFGNTGGQPSAIPRYPLTWRTLKAANRDFASQNSWTLLSEGLGSLQNSTSATVAGMSGVTLNPQFYPTVRAVFFDQDGISAQTRNVLQINGNQISWSENTINTDVNGNGVLDDFPMPAGFKVGNVRIEQQEFRYTFLITVRAITRTGVDYINGPTLTQMQQGIHFGTAVNVAEICGHEAAVVVFYGREFAPDDEALVPVVFTGGRQQVAVNYGATKPFMRKGGFVLDANNGYWYRISNVADNAAARTATLTIEVPAGASSPPAQGVAMFLRNVVDVFPIGSKQQAGQ